MDRRARRTQSKLKEALITLMKNKDINQITVKELAELADINRKTFYLHYRDIFDMLDNVKQDLLEEFTQVISLHNDIKNDVDQPLLLMKDTFEFVDKNSEILSILIGTELNSDFIFINKMKDLMKEHCVNVWNKLYPNVNKNNYEYLYSAAFYGYIGLAQTWINSNKKDSPDYMAKITSQVILKLFDSIE